MFTTCIWLLYFTFLFSTLIFIFLVLGIQPRASHMLSRCFTVELHSQTLCYPSTSLTPAYLFLCYQPVEEIIGGLMDNPTLWICLVTCSLTHWSWFSSSYISCKLEVRQNLVHWWYVYIIANFASGATGCSTFCDAMTDHYIEVVVIWVIEFGKIPCLILNLLKELPTSQVFVLTAELKIRPRVSLVSRFPCLVPSFFPWVPIRLDQETITQFPLFSKRLTGIQNKY
jgi:hypothetical protein